MKHGPTHPLSRFSRYFAAVADHRGLRRAAEELHVSASAVDRQILMAEEELGMALFERSHKGMTLTEAGQLLLADVRRWQREYEKVMEQVDELKGLRRGHVTIAVIDALSEGGVTDAIVGAGLLHPDFTFELRVLGSRQVAEQVSNFEVDFGVLLDPAAHVQLDVVARTSIRMGLVIPIGHPLAQLEQVSLKQVLELRQVMPAAPLMVESKLRPILSAHALMSRPATVCNDTRLMRALIRGGAGVGILSFLDVANDVAEGRLSFVPLRARQASPIELALCVAPNRQLSLAARAVLKHVRSAIELLNAPLDRGTKPRSRRAQQ